MTEQEEFFSPSHNRLLNIATWAKYLAWVALVVYILNAILQVMQYQFSLNTYDPFQQNVWPFRGFEFIVSVASTALRGIIFYLILKGISLGLNMIVETDINYREQERGAE